MSFSSLLVSTLSLLSSLHSFTHALPTVPVRIGIPANGTVVHPGGVENLLVVKNTTLNATTPAGASFAPQSVPSSYLPINLVNYYNDNNIKAYITGRNANNQLVFVGPGGQWYWPSTSSSSPVPIPDSSIALSLGGKGSTYSITVPGYLSAGRIWFSDGPLKFYVVATPNGPGLVEPAAVNNNDPNAATNYGFAELTWINGGLFADISYVDFVGMPNGLKLTTNDGSGTQQALGLPSYAVPAICSALQGQSRKDGQPWSSECVYSASGQLLRVLAPPLSISQDGSRWRGYFDGYVNQVLQTYSSQPLYINSQSSAGRVQCSTNPGAGTISCNGDNRSYSRPSAADIFGCNSGPFAIQGGDNGVHYAVVPRLCAAFNRGTFTVNGGNYQPSVGSSQYYLNSPVNYYSKFVHQYEYNGLGYAFSYDDVTADGQPNTAGVVSSGSPNTLTVMIGGYDLA